MTGQFSELVQYGLSQANDTGLDHAELKKKKRQLAGVIAPDELLYSVPYPEQTRGLTKYAPMGARPGTTIIAKSAPPQFPTSAYSVASTILGLPTWQTTLTETRTWATSGIENTVSPAAQRRYDIEIQLLTH